MNNMDTIPGYNADREEWLKSAAKTIYHRYLTEANIYPLLLSDTEATRNNLNRVGALYKIIQSSIRFAQYRRAAWYIGTLNKFCKCNFGQTKCQAAQIRMNTWFV